MKVVLVDDSRSALFALQSSLSNIEGIKLITFTAPDEALTYCLANPVDLLFIDYMMPGHTGIDIIKALKQSPDYDLVPIVMVTAERQREVLIAAIEAGATEFVSKPFDAIELQARATNLVQLRKAHLELSRQAARLEEEVAHATQEVVSREEEIIWRLARAIEFRDGATGDHISRVAKISQLIAADLGLDKETCRMIYLVAPLHDVGKIGIADCILQKPGKLTSDEIAEMRKHVEFGVSLLGNGASRLLQVAEAIAGGHHEKWDGTGYPNGLKGKDIPLVARIVAVADVFEALCTERPYKKAWAIDAARDHIRENSGLHFDPDCVAAFDRQWPAIQKLMTHVNKAHVEPPALAVSLDDTLSLSPKGRVPTENTQESR
ncbi:putative two-component system response regulator [Agrobacterium larrymoorei]|uniref:Two-component system response regulator n=1 Tax=Agrobacterium larrymoorei TaxID=160699 RepID=A0AAJ2BE83_9HYPH|nr:HD domain-containing phosphohydrolase [Agrobacterium larrymoorei]MDR6101254.1 putative two-component system response regulator [Agrobacterium larrymoorei]